MRLHNGVNLAGGEAKWVCRVPHLLLGEAVDHRPLVQPEAAERPLTGQGGREETAHEVDGPSTGSDEASDVEADVPAADGIVSPRRPRQASGTGEHHAWSRVPSAQPRDGMVVVLMEEVLDRVLYSCWPPHPVVSGQGVDPLRVRGLSTLPLRTLQPGHSPTVDPVAARQEG